MAISTHESGRSPAASLLHDPDTAGLGARVRAIHAEKLQMCDQLEAIADSLPFHIDRAACLGVASRLTPLMLEAHRFEEDYLFPAIEATRPGASGRATTRRLKSEHVHDECSAAEISEELARIGNGAAVRNAEALGFMLRAFFETVRRHLASEREHVVSPAPSASGEA